MQQTNAQQGSTIFNEPTFIPTNKIIIVNKSKILEVLLKLKGEKALSLLRNGVLYLKYQLIDTKSDKKGIKIWGTIRS